MAMSKKHYNAIVDAKRAAVAASGNNKKVQEAFRVFARELVPFLKRDNYNFNAAYFRDAMEEESEGEKSA